MIALLQTNYFDIIIFQILSLSLCFIIMITILLAGLWKHAFV